MQVRIGRKRKEGVFKAVPRKLLKAELTADKMLCETRHGGNFVYDITYKNAPNLMQEIGRLRELSFRDAGGGTGHAVDIDEFDICANPFHQLLVWSPKEREVISCYRYILGENIPVSDKDLQSPTAKLFAFSDEFIRNYLPYSIELGRSFVQTKYQVGNKGIFALDNIWDGLGALLGRYPEMKYFYGKMTMYKNYNKLARDLVLFFLKKHFPPTTPLMLPHKPLSFFHSETMLSSILTAADFKEDFKILNREMTTLQCRVPPLINIYMGLSPTLQCFGTADNAGFGDVEETAILIKIEDIYEGKKERYINKKT
jgi:hypothetical protein